MRARQLFALLLAILAATLVASGCGDDDTKKDSGSRSNDSSKTSDTPAPLKADGQFSVCTDVPYPPAEYLEGTKFVGYEIDVMDEVARRLGVTTQYEKTLFDAIIPALQSKRCDAIISSMNVTPEREKQVGFVRYMEIGQSFMVAAGNTDAPQTLNDLSGMTVAVQVGTTLKDSLDTESKRLKADGKKGIDVKTFPDGGAAAAALKADKVDVFFADSPVVADYVNKDGDSFAFGGEPIDPLPVGIAMRTDDGELRDAVQNAMDEMYQDGSMVKLLSKWKVQDFALADANVSDGGASDKLMSGDDAADDA